MVKNKISRVLCPLVLLSSFSLNSNAASNKTVTKINNKKLYTVEKEVEVISAKKDDNQQSPLKFEDKWVSVVKKIIDSSIESNKTNLKTNNIVGADSPGFCYSSEGFGGMIYSDGYTSFSDFKKDIFETILRDFLEKRLKKLTSMIIEQRGGKDKSTISIACEEVKQIVQVFADNSFNDIIANFADLESVKIPMKIVCVNS